jgi:hypothetical protein
MAIAIDDRVVDFRTDLFRGHMRAHDLLRKSGGLNAPDCAASTSAAPQRIGAEHCTQRKATPHLRRGRRLSIATR